MLVTIMDTIGSTALGSTGRGMVGAGPESPCSVRGMRSESLVPQRLLCGPASLLRAAFTSMVKGTRGRSGGERKAKSKEQEQAGSGARSANVTAFPSAEMFVKMSIFYVAASSCTAHVFVLTIPVTPEIPAWMRYAG